MEFFLFSLLATLVIDIAIRKSSLGNLPLKKVVSGSFKHRSYHTDSPFFLPLSLNSVKLSYISWKFQGQRPRFMEIQHESFFITVPLNFHVFNPLGFFLE